MLLSGPIVLLRVQIEEGWAHVGLGAFSESEHFVRLEARLSSTSVELELFVVLRLDNIPTHHLGHLLHPIVQGRGGRCLVKLFSLSLHQQLVVFVLVIELPRSGSRGAWLSIGSLRTGNLLAAWLLLGDWRASSWVWCSFWGVFGSHCVLVGRTPLDFVRRCLVDGLLASWQ